MNRIFDVWFENNMKLHLGKAINEKTIKYIAEQAWNEATDRSETRVAELTNKLLILKQQPQNQLQFSFGK